jgi:hypothetical protein
MTMTDTDSDPDRTPIQPEPTHQEEPAYRHGYPAEHHQHHGNEVELPSDPETEPAKQATSFDILKILRRVKIQITIFQAVTYTFMILTVSWSAWKVYDTATSTLNHLTLLEHRMRTVEAGQQLLLDHDGLKLPEQRSERHHSRSGDDDDDDSDLVPTSTPTLVMARALPSHEAPTMTPALKATP